MSRKCIKKELSGANSLLECNVNGDKNLSRPRDKCDKNDSEEDDFTIVFSKKDMRYQVPLK